MKDHFNSEISGHPNMHLADTCCKSAKQALGDLRSNPLRTSLDDSHEMPSISHYPAQMHVKNSKKMHDVITKYMHIRKVGSCSICLGQRELIK